MKIREVDKIINKAKEAEDTRSYFISAIYYKEALLIALKNNDSKSITLFKNKAVEMNRKLALSGKDFQKYEFVYELTEKQQSTLQDFLVSILKINDIGKLFITIGELQEFMPKLVEVEKLAKKTMPVAYQIATLNTVSADGHNLRGGSDGAYSWFIQMYDLTQKQILNLYLGRLMDILLKKNPVGKVLTIADFEGYFSKSYLFSTNQLDIIRVGLRKYVEGDFISALHILVPQYESLLLKIISKFGLNIVALDTSIDVATRTTTLSERDFESDGFKKIFGVDLCRQIKFVLFEPMGYRLRHKIAHGEINQTECNFDNTTIIVYLYLVLLAKFNDI